MDGEPLVWLPQGLPLTHPAIPLGPRSVTSPSQSGPFLTLFVFVTLTPWDVKVLINWLILFTVCLPYHSLRTRASSFSEHIVGAH